MISAKPVSRAAFSLWVGISIVFSITASRPVFADPNCPSDGDAYKKFFSVAVAAVSAIGSVKVAKEGTSVPDITTVDCKNYPNLTGVSADLLAKAMALCASTFPGVHCKGKSAKVYAGSDCISNVPEVKAAYSTCVSATKKAAEAALAASKAKAGEASGLSSSSVETPSSTGASSSSVAPPAVSASSSSAVPVPTTGSKSGLSKGAKVGIGVGAAVVAAGTAALIVNANQAKGKSDYKCPTGFPSSKVKHKFLGGKKAKSFYCKAKVASKAECDKYGGKAKKIFLSKKYNCKVAAIAKDGSGASQVDATVDDGDGDEAN